MKSLSSFIILVIVFQFFAKAQSKDTLFAITYHANKKISTKSVKFENGVLWGYAKAFDQKGNQIFNMQTRRVAGHASVNFSFHPNGMVKTAHYTSHPDGGIQWSDIKYFFDENGKQTHVDDRSSDIYGRHTLHPTVLIQHEKPEQKREIEKPNQPKTESMKCAAVCESTVILVNLSKKKTKFNFTTTVKMNNPTISPNEIALGDSLKIGSFTDAETFTHPKEKLRFELLQPKTKIIWDEPVEKNKNQRVYYAVIVSSK